MTMKKLHKNIYMHTTGEGLNVGCVVGEDGAVSIDLPNNPDEALQWRAQIQELTPKPLRTIIFTSPDRVSSDALKALAPNLGAFSLPSIIQDAGFNQLYAALEAAQPRMLEPLSPVQLRERAVLPDVTFSNSATFTLGLEDPVRVDMANAGEFIPGSSIVTIRDSGVVFVGWLVAGHEPPMLRNANVDAWTSALGNLRRNRKIKVIVPASGSAGDLSTMTQTQEYLKAAFGGVKKLVRTHKPREAISTLVPDLLKMYMTGNALDHPFIAQRVQGNLERIYDELTVQSMAEPIVEP